MPDWGAKDDSLGGLQAGGAEENEKGAVETDFAAGGIVPLVEGMSAPTATSGANGDGGDAEGERNVGIGGGAFKARAIPQDAVSFADNGKQRRILGQFATGTNTDGLNLD